MTDPVPHPVRALSLLSGGLDSQLAVCVLREQGIEVECVVFESPFFGPAAARIAVRQLGVPLHVLPFTEDILTLLRGPKHGFGSEMNPCIDCHARMFQRAGKLMEEKGFHFLSTGEVLNERPMSQNKRSLGIVARESGHEGWVLRPLSARLLPETEPERRGWVDRSRLLSLEGRGRKEQIRLAAHYGIRDYPTPAGGCRLTEPNFSRRLRELQAHEGLDSVRNIGLLRLGRHVRLGPAVKLIVGRNASDNAALREAAEPQDVLLNVVSIPGPTGLVTGAADESQLRLAAAICARYSDAGGGRTVAVNLSSGAGARLMEVDAADREQTDAMLL